MKWIGQYIQSLIARFRNDVYFESVPDGTIDSGKNLGLDSSNKLVKATVTGGGGGSIATDSEFDVKGDLIVGTGDNAADRLPVGSNGQILTADSSANNKGVKWANAPGSEIDVVVNGTTYSNIDTLTFMGNDVQAFDNGTGDVLLNIDDISVSFADTFGVMTDPVSSMGNYHIADPVVDTGKFFYAGTWAGDNNRKCTSSTNINFSTYNSDGGWVSNFENDPKIVVSAFGSTDNLDISSQEAVLATHTHTVISSGSGSSTNSNGITVQVTNIADDVISTKRKGKFTVSFNPTSSAGSTYTGDSANLSGSQKYTRIQVKLMSNDLNTQYGTTFNTSAFFFDGQTQAPTTGDNLTVSFSSTATKYLSNIKYHSAGSFSTTGGNIQHFHRDTTETNENDVELSILSNWATDDTKYAALSNHDGSTDDDQNSFTITNWTLNSSKYSLSEIVYGRILNVFGGLANNSGAQTAMADSARAYNTFTSSSDRDTEDFKDETYRLPDWNEAQWRTNAVDNSVDNFLDKFTLNSAGVHLHGSLNNHGASKDHLVQVHHSNTVFKLQHPDNVGTIATSPAQDKFTGSAPTGYVKYYRFFHTGGPTTSSIAMKFFGMTRSNYKTDYLANKIRIYISRVGSDNTWVPLIPGLNPGPEYDGQNPNGNCWHPNNDITNSSWNGYIANSNTFDMLFGGGSPAFVLRLEFTEDFTRSIYKIQFYSSNQGQIV